VTSARQVQLVCAATLLSALTACPDTHGVLDASTSGSPTLDASGDAPGRDAYAPPPCQIEGRAIAAVEGAATEFEGCSCGEGMVTGIGIRAPAPLAVELGPFALCIPPRTAARIIAGLCGGGQVVHLWRGRRSEALGADFVDELTFGDGCMDALACLFAEQQLPAEMRPGCLYPDYTVAETGVVPPSGDCDTLRTEGLCSIDCPCVGDPDLADCFGMSERQPIGVCAEPPFCLPGAQPCLGGVSCVIWFMEPEFASDMESAVPAGRCVPPSACEAFRARAGSEWICHPPTS
jgi:hypothetical protein